MTRADLDEAAALLRDALDELLTLARAREGAQSADLRRACGALRADARAAIQACAVGDRLAACFAAGWEAGADLAGWDRFRCWVAARTPAGWPAVALRGALAMLSLQYESMAIASTAFQSRDDVDAMQARMNDAFDSAEATAADDQNFALWRLLVGLHTAVTQDLVERARPLPRMVRYGYAGPRPSLWIANRLYGDGARGGEIARENKAAHPLFMPRAGRALST